MNTSMVPWRDIFGQRATPWVIAEIGVNHCGDPRLARQLVDAAAQAGADGVKFQVFVPDELVAADAPLAAYQKAAGGAATQKEMLAALALSAQDLRDLKRYAEDLGLLFLATPFDPDSLRFLAELGVRAIKIGSGDLLHPMLLAAAAATGLPLILSTGMASLREVATAVEWLQAAGAAPLMLLHCTSSYPADPGQANLRAITTLRRAFGVPVGYSDHTAGDTAAVVATALGILLLEKHLTLDRHLPGPDHQASATPDEFAALVKAVRLAGRALGTAHKLYTPAEAELRYVARRGLIARADIAAGDRLDERNVAAVRPCAGIPAEMWPAVKGSRARVPIAGRTRLNWADIELPSEPSARSKGVGL